MKVHCAAIGVLWMCACGPSPSDSEIRDSLPTAAQVRIAGPAAASAPPSRRLRGSSPSELALLYVATRTTSDTLNGMAMSAIGLIGGIASAPPTKAGPDYAVWGPFTDSLSPATFRLTVENLGGGQFHFLLEARAKKSTLESDFASVVAGDTWPSQASGQLDADMAGLRALDPLAAPPTVNEVKLTFSAANGQRRVTLQLSTDDETAINYAFAELPDGAGELWFANQGAVPGHAPQVEVGFIRSQWTSDGAGRADVVTQDPASDSINAITECWDSSFAVTFQADQSQIIGSPSSCSVAQALAQQP